MCGRMCGRSRRFFWHWMRADVEADGWEDFRRRSRKPGALGSAAGHPQKGRRTGASKQRCCHLADHPMSRRSFDEHAAFWRRLPPKLAHRELPSTRCCATGLRLAAVTVLARGACPPTLPMAASETPEIAGNGRYGLAGCVWPKPSGQQITRKVNTPRRSGRRPA